MWLLTNDKRSIPVYLAFGYKSYVPNGQLTKFISPKNFKLSSVRYHAQPAKMFKFLILVALVPAVMLQNADNINYDDWDVVPFRPCAGARPPPASLRIENCPQMPCQLRRGTSAMMVMDYTSRKFIICTQKYKNNLIFFRSKQ